MPFSNDPHWGSLLAGCLCVVCGVLESMGVCGDGYVSEWEKQVSEAESFQEGAGPSERAGDDHLWEVDQHGAGSASAVKATSLSATSSMLEPAR